jgi:hypothetical protein
MICIGQQYRKMCFLCDRRHATTEEAVFSVRWSVRWLCNESFVARSGTVNYGHESHGSRTQKCLHWQGPGAIVNNRPVLSSERAPHINKPATV